MSSKPETLSGGKMTTESKTKTDFRAPTTSKRLPRAVSDILHRVGALSCLFTLVGIAFLPTVAVADGFSSDRITVNVEGEGDDVLLISGLGSSPRVWRELIRAVPGHRYHLVQISGFAGQPKRGNTEGLVAAPAAEELARYIATMRISKPAVIGHSLGGLIGLMLAERHPQAIAKLMVIDVRPFMGAAFGPPGTTAESIKPVADAILAQMEGLDPAGRQQQAQVTIDGMINTVGKRKSALEDWMKSDPDVVARALHEGFVTDLSPDLSKIAVPTVVLYTTMKNNQLTDLQTDSVYQAAYKPLNGVVLKHIPHTAHFIMWDQPELFQTEVVAFLRWNFGLERKNESNEQITENSQEPNVQ